MSRRDKLIERMRSTPHKIRFSEVDALFTHEGFVLFNARGSHRTYLRADGRLLTVVRPPARGRRAIPTMSARSLRSSGDDQQPRKARTEEPGLLTRGPEEE